MRPFVFVNLAMSADGKLSTRERRQVKISGTGDFQRVDAIKADSDAIMVGIGTVLADNPSLTVKSHILREKRKTDGMDEHPIRVVVDSTARTPLDADILHKGTGRRIIAVSNNAPVERVRALELHAEIIQTGEKEVALPDLLSRLYGLGVRRLMVEGGGTLIWSLFREGCVDEFYTFIGNLVIGGKDAPTPADGGGFVKEEEFPRLKLLDSEVIEGGVLLRWKVGPD